MTPFFRNLSMVLFFSALPVQADVSLTGGLWFNYAYQTTEGADEPNNGVIGEETLVIYIDGADERHALKTDYSIELQMGPGSFTDTANNSTGDQFSIHKAWIGFHLDANHHLKVGKSQVPFGWKTTNFWPGDMFQAGYGDQMDVGLKLSGQKAYLFYDVAYYHQDDWGKTSTDTLADNRHWGSSTTYRKVQTWVAQVGKAFNNNHKLYLGLQSGGLQELVTADREIKGYHQAAVVAYEGKFNDTFMKAEWIYTNRKLPSNYANQQNLKPEITNNRAAFEVGHSFGDLAVYFDATWAESESHNTDAITAYAPGLRYQYGAGYVYLEYLTQNGWIDRNGQIQDNSDFSSVYLTMDVYF